MYKVQTQNPRARQARLGFTILAIATIFATCFFMTQAIMTAVYGYELKANGSAYVGLGAAAAAVINPIDNYVQNVKGDICPTLKNITAEAQCMAL